MKKTFTYILSIFMAVLVFYGGAGINVISYCCKECRSAGIEALLNDKCCDIHHHNHTKTNHKHESSTSCRNHIAHAGDSQCMDSSRHAENLLHSGNSCCNTESSCCDSEHAKSHNSDTNHSSGDNCNMERIDFDWSFQNADELKIDLSPDVHDLFSTSLFNNTSAYLPFICENNTVMSNGPPLVLSRDYLSVLTVLLI